MGFNTTVFILNDRLGEIERDPEKFVKGILHTMDGGGEIVGQTIVMPTAHADVPRLYFTHGNAIVELSKYSRDTELLLRSNLPPARRFVKESLKRAQQELRELAKHIKAIEASEATSET